MNPNPLLNLVAGKKENTMNELTDKLFDLAFKKGGIFIVKLYGYSGMWGVTFQTKYDNVKVKYVGKDLTVQLNQLIMKLEETYNITI